VIKIFPRKDGIARVKVKTASGELVRLVQAIGDMHEYSKDDGTKYGYNQAKQEHGIGTYYAR